MFNWLKRSHGSGGATRRSGGASRAAGATVRESDLADLVAWAGNTTGVEGYVEPETFVNEMSILLVDATGAYLRRPIGGPKGIDVIANRLSIPIYDVEETGYPPRMRARIETDRIIRRRLEQMERRAKFESEHPDQ
ncbi:MAG: oxidoreductase [Corynebacterium sp.]|nr:oxidoreductase [Corynebacterium sp.]